MDEIESEQERLKDLAFGIGGILQEAGHRVLDEIEACEQDAEDLLKGLRVMLNRLAIEEEADRLAMEEKGYAM